MYPLVQPVQPQVFPAGASRFRDLRYIQRRPPNIYHCTLTPLFPCCSQAQVLPQELDRGLIGFFKSLRGRRMAQSWPCSEPVHCL